MPKNDRTKFENANTEATLVAAFKDHDATRIDRLVGKGNITPDAKTLARSGVTQEDIDTTLRFAAMKGLHNAFSSIVNHTRVDIDSIHSSLVIAAQGAVSKGHRKIVEEILATNPPHTIVQDALYISAQNGHLDAARSLIAGGGNPNEKHAESDLSPVELAMNKGIDGKKTLNVLLTKHTPRAGTWSSREGVKTPEKIER